MFEARDGTPPDGLCPCGPSTLRGVRRAVCVKGGAGPTRAIPPPAAARNRRGFLRGLHQSGCRYAGTVNRYTSLHYALSCLYTYISVSYRLSHGCLLPSLPARLCCRDARSTLYTCLFPRSVALRTNILNFCLLPTTRAMLMHILPRLLIHCSPPGCPLMTGPFVHLLDILATRLQQKTNTHTIQNKTKHSGPPG